MEGNKISTNFEAWNKALAQSIEQPLSGSAISYLLGSIIDFDMLMIFQYSDGEALSIWHNVDAQRKHIVIDDYLRGPFLLDPFYTHSVEAESAKFMAMRELSPDHFYNSEFYRRHYNLTGIIDEIGIATPISSTVSNVLSVARYTEHNSFNHNEKNIFKAAAPILSALSRKLVETPHHQLLGAGLKKNIDDAFNHFGSDLLSPREIEIVSLILKGHSSISIGLLLEISTGTVKIHRKNIYAKLNISSQAELFNRFIRYFTNSN